MVLLYSLDDLVHLCIVLGGEVGEIDVGRDEGPAQDVVVEVPQDFLSISAAQKRQQSKNIKKKVQVKRQDWAPSRGTSQTPRKVTEDHGHRYL